MLETLLSQPCGRGRKRTTELREVVNALRYMVQSGCEWRRHIAVDADGRLLAMNLTTVDISDSAGVMRTLNAIRRRWPAIKHLLADGTYDRRKLLGKAAFLDFTVEVVRRSDNNPGFEAIPRCRVVKRSTGGLTRYRRLVRDCEGRLDVSGAMIFLAMGNLLVRRISHP